MDRGDHPVLLSRTQISQIAISNDKTITRGHTNLMVADGEAQAFKLRGRGVAPKRLRSAEGDGKVGVGEGRRGGRLAESKN